MYKTFQGIVLKRNRFSDNSAYITVMTENGIEKFSAKGILSPKSKNAPAAALFALSEFIVSIRGDTATLSSASLIKPLIRQGVDFEELALANYLVCLAHDTAFSEDDAPKIYRLLGTSLSVINKKQTSPKIIKAVFELRLMAELGFFPDIEFCSRCSEEFSSGVFLPLEGTVLCKKCEILSEKKKIPLSEGLKNGLETMFSLPEKSAFGIRFSQEKTENAFASLAEEFSINHLDCALSALNYYKTNLKNLTELQ